MTLVRFIQHKNDLSPQIKAALIELRDFHGMSWRDISPKIGVAESTISKVYSEKKKGGRQLLCALTLLLELTLLQKRIAEMEAARAAFAAFAAPAPANYQLNDAPLARPAKLPTGAGAVTYTRKTNRAKKP